jgi:hypothetical protein
MAVHEVSARFRKEPFTKGSKKESHLDLRPITARLYAAALAEGELPTPHRPGISWNELYRSLCAHPLMRREDGRREGDALIRAQIAMSPEEYDQRTYFLDEDGLLRRRAATQEELEMKRKYTEYLANKRAYSPEMIHALKIFLDNRIVGRRKSIHYWFKKVVVKESVFTGLNPTTGLPIYRVREAVRFCQDRPLTSREVELFKGFPQVLTRDVLASAPIPPMLSSPTQGVEL